MDNTLKDRLAILVKSVGGKKQLVERTGLSPKTVWNYLNGETTPSEAKLRQIANDTDVRPEWLISGDGAMHAANEAYPPVAEMHQASERLAALRSEQVTDHLGFINPTIPVHGLAAASPIGHFAVSAEPIEYVPPPPGLLRVPGAYALIVDGASMVPKYQSGEMIFIHPNRPIRPGDYVVVQEARDGGLFTLVKLFERQTEKHLYLRQHNPDAEVRVDRRAVTATHRILTTNELFGI